MEGEIIIIESKLGAVLEAALLYRACKAGVPASEWRGISFRLDAGSAKHRVGFGDVRCIGFIRAECSVPPCMQAELVTIEASEQSEHLLLGLDMDEPAHPYIVRACSRMKRCKLVTGSIVAVDPEAEEAPALSGESPEVHPWKPPLRHQPFERSFNDPANLSLRDRCHHFVR